MPLTNASESGDTQSPQREVERIRTHLRTVVKVSGMTQREIAKRAQITPWVLSKMLREDGAGFTMDRTLAVLAAIGHKPEDFYGKAYGFRPDQEYGTS